MIVNLPQRRVIMLLVHQSMDHRVSMATLCPQTQHIKRKIRGPTSQQNHSEELVGAVRLQQRIPVERLLPKPDANAFEFVGWKMRTTLGKHEGLKYGDRIMLGLLAKRK